jgi:hypothetical protein
MNLPYESEGSLKYLKAIRYRSDGVIRPLRYRSDGVMRPFRELSETQKI